MSALSVFCDDAHKSASYRVDHVLYRFDKSLPDARENTKKAYNTDIWLCLVDVFYRFWNFPSRYNPVAKLIAGLHALDCADKSLEAGRIEQAQLEACLNKSRSLLPVVNQKRITSGDSLNLLLGEHFSVTTANGVTRMQLRPIISSKDMRLPARVQIRHEDSMMLDVILGCCDQFLDNEFWDLLCLPAMIGEVLTHQETNGVSKNTIARRISALRKFERFLHLEGLRSTRTICFMDRPRVNHRSQITLTPAELAKLYQYSTEQVRKPSDLLEIRNRAIIFLLDGTLARASAICNANYEDVDLKSKQIHVVEKGGKELFLPLEGRALEYLKDYLKIRNQFKLEFKVAEHSANALFFTAHPRGGSRLDRRSVSRILNQTAKDAGVKKQVSGKQSIGAHVIRRSVAGEMHNRGARLEDLQEVLGHSSAKTTEIYLRGSKQAARKTILKHHLRAK